MTISNMLAALPKLLRWDDNPEVDAMIADLAVIYYQRSADGLGKALGQIRQADPYAYDCISGRLKDLPDSIYLRLLGAPHTWFLVTDCEAQRHKPQEIAFYLNQALAAEVIRAGDTVELRQGVWSCLGDYYFPSQNLGTTSTLRWQNDAPFVAPCLPGGIPVDFWSPWARGKLPEIPGTDSDMKQPEIVQIWQKLDRGLRAAQHVCPTTIKVLTCFCKVIVARQDPTITEHRAASSPTTIGRPVLRNPQLLAATEMELIDSIIHETIHAIIDIVNLEQPLMLDRSVLTIQRGNSPWTGRSLDLYTYIHACLVWYGLWHFWSRAWGRDIFPDPAVFHYMQLSAKGFMSPDLLEPLLKTRQAIAPSLIDLISDMQKCIQSNLNVLNTFPNHVSL
jgi:hypothetical protein